LADLLALIEVTPHLDWLMLTKRPELWRGRIDDAADARTAIDAPGAVLAEQWMAGAAPANVWVGATVEDRKRQVRLDHLRAIPARVRFASCEPLLESIEPDMGGIHWVIAGGESGLGARPMHPDWVRSLRDQCQAAGVAFHFKQWGEWCPCGKPGDQEPAKPRNAWLWGDGTFGEAAVGSRGSTLTRPQRMARTGKKAAGHLLDGRTWDEVPS